MSEQLSHLVQHDLDTFTPIRVPPFAQLQAVHTRRVRRRRSALALTAAATVLSTVAVVPTGLDALSPEARDGVVAQTGSAALRVGQEVPVKDLQFGTASFDAAAPGRVLTEQVDGVQVLGYRNDDGAACLVDLGIGRPACYDDTGFFTPTDRILLLHVDPAKVGTAASPADTRPVIFGYGPPGTASVTVERGAQTFEVDAQGAGPDLHDLSFFLAPSPDGSDAPAATFTARAPDGTSMGRLVQPPVDSPQEAASRQQSLAVRDCWQDNGYVIVDNLYGGWAARETPQADPAACKALFNKPLPAAPGK